MLFEGFLRIATLLYLCLPIIVAQENQNEEILGYVEGAPEDISKQIEVEPLQTQEEFEEQLDQIIEEIIQEESQVTEETEIKEESHGKQDTFRFEDISYPFTESLDVTLLPRNHILTSFDFKLSSEPQNISKTNEFTHYKAFPRSLAPMLEQANAKELHLRFGQGWWDAEQWGQLPNSGRTAGGVGVEIWAVLEAKDQEDGLAQWISLVNSLSGLFCASLNFIDRAKTIYPVNSIPTKANSTLFDKSNKLFLFRAALASEPVCTENLTPFLKFLPTRGKSGISTLLDGHRVYESLWHMMSIDIETDCKGDICRYIMNQKIDSVSNINRSLLRKLDPIPKPLSGSNLRCDPTKPLDLYQCFALEDPEELTFDLSDIFSRSIVGSSFISEQPSKVCVHATDNWKVFLSVDGSHYGTSNNCFELKESKKYDIYFSSSNSSSVPTINEAPIHVSRSLTGYAQDKGDSRTAFTNPTNDYVKLVYLESLPWFMRPYLHSLKISGGLKDNIVKSIYYLPEVDRQRPSHIEFELVIPPNSVVSLSYPFDKSLLLYAEYPPDANHGFSVEPGLISVIEPSEYYLRTSSALLTLPTPDFSMPYNVIILTSTIMSLSFGTIFNLLVKKIVTEEEAELVGAVGPVGVLLKIRERINSRIIFLKNTLLSKILPSRKTQIKTEVIEEEKTDLLKREQIQKEENLQSEES